MTFPGDHNDVRPIEFYHAARQLLVRSLTGGLKTATSLFEGLPSDPDGAFRSPGSRSPLNHMDSDRAVQFNRLSSARATNDARSSCKAYPNDWGSTEEEVPPEGPGEGEEEKGPAGAASQEGEVRNRVGEAGGGSGGADGGGDGGGGGELGSSVAPPGAKPRLWVPERDGPFEEDCPPRPA
jgi:hypothetical protein